MFKWSLFNWAFSVLTHHSKIYLKFKVESIWDWRVEFRRGRNTVCFISSLSLVFNCLLGTTGLWLSSQVSKYVYLKVRKFLSIWRQEKMILRFSDLYQLPLSSLLPLCGTSGELQSKKIYMTSISRISFLLFQSYVFTNCGQFLVVFYIDNNFILHGLIASSWFLL